MTTRQVNSFIGPRPAPKSIDGYTTVIRKKKKDLKKTLRKGMTSLPEMVRGDGKSRRKYEQSPEDLAVRASMALRKAEIKKVAEEALSGVPISLPAYTATLTRVVSGVSYSDATAMRLRNAADGKPKPQMFVQAAMVVPEPNEKVASKKKQQALSSQVNLKPWQPRLIKVDTEEIPLMRWAPLSGECRHVVRLIREGHTCKVVVDDAILGGWRVLRMEDSDVMSQILSVTMWGSTDQPLGSTTLTPDHCVNDGGLWYAYEAKVRHRAEERTRAIIDAVSRYSSHSEEVRVVALCAGELWSNYDWSRDKETLARGEFMNCALKDRAGLLRMFKKLFSDIATAPRDGILSLGSGKGPEIAGKDDNPWDYMNTQTFESILADSKREPDSLDHETVMAGKDDHQVQHPACKTFIEEMCRETSKHNQAFKNGVFKAKVYGFPLFGFKKEITVRLHGVDADVCPPIVPEQETESSEHLVKDIFDAIRKEKESENEDDVFRWSTSSAAANYVKATAARREVDIDTIETLTAKIIDIAGEGYGHLDREDKIKATKRVMDEIEALAQMPKGDRVSRGRRALAAMASRVTWGAKPENARKDYRTSTFYETPTAFKERAERREALWKNKAEYDAAQKNLPFVEDPELDAFIEAELGESLAPDTQSADMIREYPVASKGRDSNYDDLYTLDKVSQEVTRSLGHESGSSIYVKAIPYTASWVLVRNSGRQAVCMMVVDTRAHTLRELRWWKPLKGTTLMRSKYFTLSRDKCAMFMNSEETYRVIKTMMEDFLKEEWGQTDAEKAKSLTMFSNLIHMILATQRQPDSTILSYSRYIGMILDNNSMNRGPVFELIKKIERIKTRLSLFVVRKFLKWIEDRERNCYTVEERGRSDWEYKDWLTGFKSVSHQVRTTMYYVGNIYEKSLGERAAAIRGPMEKLLALAYKAVEGKNRGPDDPKRVNKVGERLQTYKEHYQVNHRLVAKVITEAHETHLRKNKNAAADWERVLMQLIEEFTGQKAGTNRSSFNHNSDSMMPGVVVQPVDGGKRDVVSVGSANENFTLKEAVTIYPKVFFPNPLRNFESIVWPVRVSVVPKEQLQTKREILILTPAARLSILSLEMVMRAIATGYDNEVLTNKHKEEKISGYAGYISAKRSSFERKGIKVAHVRSRTSADATKWCQLFRMTTFMIMVRCILKDHPTLRDHCLEVLDQHVAKKIQIPASILREVAAGNVFNEPSLSKLSEEFDLDTEVHTQGECMVNIPDNMLQGILHYTSSVYHSLCQNYFTERLKEELDSLLLKTASELYIPAAREQARTHLRVHNTRKQRESEMENVMWTAGQPRELIDSEKLKLREEAKASLRWLRDNLHTGEKDEAEQEKLIPTWEIDYQNAASSDDSSIAIDAFVTGTASFRNASEILISRYFSKAVVAKRKFYEELGMEESLSKTSAGNGRDSMEFNSKFYVGAVVIDVPLKQALSALRPPPLGSGTTMMNHYVSSKSAVIASGGSIELCQQITIAQMTCHYKIFGSDMSQLFPFFIEDVRKTRHSALGFYEYDKNPAICGLVPQFVNHYAWLQTKETSATERGLSKQVLHELDETGVLSLGIKIEVGNGLKNSIAMEKSHRLVETFMKYLGATGNPKEILNRQAVLMLSGAASPEARHLMELVKDEKRPTNPGISPVNAYRLSTIILTSPCISVSMRDAGPGKRLNVRMSMPALMALISRSSVANKDVPIALVDSMEPSSEIVKSLMSIRTMVRAEESVSSANRAVSSTTQDMGSVHTSERHQEVLYKLWSGSTEPQVMEDFSALQKRFWWLRTTIEETMLAYPNKFEHAIDLVSYLMGDLKMDYTVRSRSGHDNSASIYTAVTKAAERQTSHARLATVLGNHETRTTEVNLNNMRFEAGMSSLFKRESRIKTMLSKVDLSDERINKLVESGTAEDQSVTWAAYQMDTTRGGASCKRLLESWTKGKLTALSSGESGRIVLSLGRAKVRLHTNERSGSATVYQIATNTAMEPTRVILENYARKTSKWLTWETPIMQGAHNALWFKPGSGIGRSRFDPTAEVVVDSEISMPRYSDVVCRARATPSGMVRVEMRLVGKDPKVDNCNILMPQGTATASPEQEMELKRMCVDRFVSFPLVMAYISGSHLNLRTLLEGFKLMISDLESWAMMIRRTMDLLTYQRLQYMRWEERLPSMRGSRLANVVGIAWSGTKADREDPEFRRAFETRVGLMTRLGYSDAQIDEEWERCTRGVEVVHDDDAPKVVSFEELMKDEEDYANLMDEDGVEIAWNAVEKGVPSSYDPALEPMSEIEMGSVTHSSLTRDVVSRIMTVTEFLAPIEQATTENAHRDEVQRMIYYLRTGTLLELETGSDDLA